MVKRLAVVLLVLVSSALGIAILLAASLAAVEPAFRQVHHDPVNPYTMEEITNILGVAKLPDGAELVDVVKVLGNAFAAMNTKHPSSSETTGFSLFICQPRAWIGAQRARAIKEFKQFGVSDVDADSREREFRVFVHPDLPANALSTWAANSAEHVVLRSTDC